MELAEKMKETALSVLPISAMVVALGLGVARLPGALLARFCLGSALVVIGLTLFRLGVEVGVSRLGERCGTALMERRNLSLMAGAAFVIGLVVTVAEPDIQVFASQVNGVFPELGRMAVIGAIALGVGAFLALGVARSVTGISLKWALAALYFVALGMMALVPGRFAGVAFDSGGATTGPLTVPFILALGLGVSAVRRGRDGGFGLTGIASIGPLIAMLVLCARAVSFRPPQMTTAMGEVEAAAGVWAMVSGAAHDVAVSALPLYGLALVLQFFLIHMTRRQFLRVTVGFAEAAAGLFLFVLGVECGFTEAGRQLGLFLGWRIAFGWGGWLSATLGVAGVLGAAVVCAEPAVWVLGDQVERVSGGMVRRRALLVFLAAATAIAVALAVVRAAAGFSLAWLLVPGYLLALGMMPFCSGMFTGMAFDSGGVASGPLTTTLVLSFTLGVGEGCGRGGDAFGVIALVAMMPLIAIQAMGLVIEARRRRGKNGERGTGNVEQGTERRGAGNLRFKI